MSTLRTRRGWLCGIALVFCTLFVQSAWAAEIPWEKSYGAAAAKAKASNKIIMVDFYTDWCTWCKKLDKTTYVAPEVVSVAKKDFVSVKVNAEQEGKALAAKYGVTGFPTILFLDAKGGIAGKIVGYREAAPFAGEMRKISTAHRALPGLEAKFKANPSDVTVSAKLATLYASRGDRAKAVKALKAAEKSDPKNSKGMLAPAYNAIADLYQNEEKFNEAIPLFKKAVAFGRPGADTDYAYLSMATCYLQGGQPKAALPILKQAVASPKTSAQGKKEAQRLIDALNEAMKRGQL